MTLVELLITILIIGILAAMVLGVAAVAGTTAREAKTRNLIARIHTLLMEQVDTYKNRRVRVQQSVIVAINGNAALTPAKKGAALAEARLYALREMMLMELPDRWTDVWLADLASAEGNPFYLDVPGSPGRTELANVYLRRYRRLTAPTTINTLTGVANTLNDLRANEGAECLYMIIMYACGDGEARSMFHDSDIGDIDGDGAPELLDGWGNPISFLRWAPGVDSEIQVNANLLDNPASGTATEAWKAAASGDHDPYDMYRVDSDAYRLVPLVFSAGRDESYGVNLEGEIYPAFRSLPTAISSTPPHLSPKFSYYLKDPIYLGTDDGTKTATDNIHNHLIGTR